MKENATMTLENYFKRMYQPDLKRYLRFYLELHIYKCNSDPLCLLDIFYIMQNGEKNFNYKTNLMREILNDILREYTAMELFYIFSFKTEAKSENNGKVLKNIALETISKYDMMDFQEKKKLKQLVRNTNPVYFKLVYQLIQESGIFSFPLNGKAA